MNILIAAVIRKKNLQFKIFIIIIFLNFIINSYYNNTDHSEKHSTIKSMRNKSLQDLKLT